MDNPTLNTEENFHYDATLCSNPDKDFEVLDYVSIGDNSENLKQPMSLLSSRYSTSNVDSNIN